MRETTRRDWHVRVERVLNEILSRIDQNLGFRDLASTAASSPYHFHRTFHDLTGESVEGCIRRLRLERAAYLLHKGKLSVLEAALESGYNSPEAFARSFRKAFGLSPSKIRSLPDWNGQLYSQAGIHYGRKSLSHWFIIPNGGEGMETKIVKMEKRRVIGLENNGDPWGLPATWEKFRKIAEQENLHQVAKNYLTAFFKEEGKEEWQIGGIETDPEVPLPDGLKEVVLPEGLYAITVHFGTPEEIGETWDRWMAKWLPESGWRLDGSRPTYEWYQNDGCSVPPELELTFLCTPVIRS